MQVMSILFGMLVGLSLGLTGGGGAIFSVPLLVYGLGLTAKEAVGISLAAVGTTALAGFLQRWWLGEVDVRTGLIFAVAGACGAPVGTWLASLLPPLVHLLSFAGLMLIVAARMWEQGSRPAELQVGSDGELGNHAACQKDASGSLVLNSRCAMLLVSVGLLTGVLAGLFGVGGGFIIVPALVLISRMSIQKAVGTSLMVMSLVSTSGILSHFLLGQAVSLRITLLFVMGGILGLLAAQRISRKISGATLQRVFAFVILLVAVFLLVRTVYAGRI